MNIDDVFAITEGELERVEAELTASIQSKVPLIGKVGSYIFESGGKRMRPLLAILSSRLCGYYGDRHIPLAVAIELIHTATLLHDDVVDHADLRRGKRSVNSFWNSETSILVGDFLFTQAFCKMVDHRDLKVLELMAATCRQLSEGEILELSKNGDIGIREEDYLEIIRLKTAVLISAACRIGALLGERSPEEEKALAGFGLKLGTAFQLIDDSLDYTAREEELGKTIGKDLEEGKITLPMIHTISICRKEERERIIDIVNSRTFDRERLLEIQDIIRKTGGLEYTREVADRYVSEAKHCLEPFEDSLEKRSMLTVADFVVSRKR